MISIFPLLLMISFASVNAVLYTPALPAISDFFDISDKTTQLTMSVFLIGYALGQLIYGPLANRYGRKPTLYLGITIQIISSLLCILSSPLENFWLLVVGRFFIAIGSGVGLKMAFTYANECYDTNIVAQKVAYIMMAFAIMPPISVALGGLLTTYVNWVSCFYLGMLYGVILFFVVLPLPETKKQLDYNALNIHVLMKNYVAQFSNKTFIAGSLLLGTATSFLYIFATIAPFIAMDLYKIPSSEYGLANIILPFGLILGAVLSSRMVVKQPIEKVVRLGLIHLVVGILLMILTTLLSLNIIIALFIPTLIIYFGTALISANASTIAMMQANDKSYGSAVMNFINVTAATISVFLVGMINVSFYSLSIFYTCLTGFMGLFYLLVVTTKRSS